MTQALIDEVSRADYTPLATQVNECMEGRCELIPPCEQLDSEAFYERQWNGEHNDADNR